MSDIFNRNLSYAGSFRPEGTSLTFAGSTGAGSNAIVRNIRLDYQQQISRIWDLGSGNVFFVAGQTNGAWGFGTVAGISGSFAIYGEICNPGTLTLDADVGICNTNQNYVTSAAYVMHETILSQVGLTAQSSDMIMNMAIGGTFLFLDQPASV